MKYLEKITGKTKWEKKINENIRVDQVEITIIIEKLERKTSKLERK